LSVDLRVLPGSQQPDSFSPPVGARDLLAFIKDWGHPEWVVLAAEAPIGPVSKVLAAAHSAKEVLHRVTLRAAGKQDNEIAPLVAVAQCANAPWSVVFVSLCLPVGEGDFRSAQDDARLLSSKLKTRALAFIGEDTSGAMGYRLYRNGEEVGQKEWDQSKTGAADKAVAELGLYLPACYPCTRRGETWLAVAGSSLSRLERADLIKFGERDGAREAQALLNAVLKNQLPVVRQLLRQGVKPAREALSKAVRKAVSSGKYDVLKELLKRKPGEHLPFGPGVVTHAIAKGPRNRRMDVVRLLLAAGADINGEGGEALRTAILQEDPTLLKFLLDAGADANASKSWGSTPLHCAAHLGQIECAKLLLQAGARPDSVDEKGETPVQWAVEYRHKELAKLLHEASRARG
jgi:hypothetical protein